MLINNSFLAKQPCKPQHDSTNLSCFSIKPENVVYQGPSTTPLKRVTLKTIKKKYEAGEKLSMVTAYDYPSAVHVDNAGIDLLLVGDSVAMVVHGHDTTLPITLDDMIVHCKAVTKGASRAFMVGDMPFGSYEASERDAVQSCVRMMKEGGMDAVKMEGASPSRIKSIRAVVDAGVAVMGHVGLTPQRVSAIGGFRPQAQVADEALKVIEEAKLLEDAGCFAMIIECVPATIGMAITRMVNIPTIGIGAGPHCSGQVLVYHDLLGMMSHPHHAKVSPKFCKQYAQVGQVIQSALQNYKEEVEQKVFPGEQFSTYKIKPEEVEKLCMELKVRGENNIASEMKQAFEDSMQ